MAVQQDAVRITVRRDAPETRYAIKEPATIVAYNLGTCGGQLMYQRAKWYFPGKGEAFKPAGHYNICTGDYVNGN